MACQQINSRANLSSLVRLAGCFGLQELTVAGRTKVDAAIAREAAEYVQLKRRRSLAPTLRELRELGYRLVGLEQASNSVPLFEFDFPERTALVIGNERRGL